MKRRHALLTALSCIVFLMPGTVRDGHAQNDSDLSRATLKGLTGVEVTVELQYNGPETEDEAGLTQTRLQTDTELTLREVGVPVVTEPSLTTGFLDLNVNCAVRPPIMMYGCSIDLNLHQLAILVRKTKNIAASATTWSVGEIYMVGGAYLSTDTPNAVQGLVKEFANAYLEQNPRNP